MIPSFIRYQSTTSLCRHTVGILKPQVDAREGQAVGGYEGTRSRLLPQGLVARLPPPLFPLPYLFSPPPFSLSPLSLPNLPYSLPPFLPLFSLNPPSPLLLPQPPLPPSPLTPLVQNPFTSMNVQVYVHVYAPHSLVSARRLDTWIYLGHFLFKGIFASTCYEVIQNHFPFPSILLPTLTMR